MDEAKRDLVRGWLTKASHDLQAARLLADASKPFLDMACYHCQQAAEKALKGFLVYHDSRTAKTHAIEGLIKQAAPFDDRLNVWLGAAPALTSFGIAFRYPGRAAVLEPAEFERGFRDAEAIYEHVLAALPPQVHPEPRS
jgi:HEPN domain-containing protein